MKKIAFTCLLWVNKPQINYPISRNPWEIIISGPVQRSNKRFAKHSLEGPGQSQTKQLRNSRNKFHQIWSTIFSGSLLMPRSSHVRNLGPLSALLNLQRKEGPPPLASRSALKFATVHGREETWVVVSQNFQVAAMDLARLELRS